MHYLLNEIICGGIVLETNHMEILKRMREQEHLSSRHTEPYGTNLTKDSSLPSKLFSRVKVGSGLITSAITAPSSARGWASALATSTASLRLPGRSGFQNITGVSQDQQDSNLGESEKLCMWSTKLSAFHFASVMSICFCLVLPFTLSTYWSHYCLLCYWMPFFSILCSCAEMDGYLLMCWEGTSFSKKNSRSVKNLTSKRRNCRLNRLRVSHCRSSWIWTVGVVNILLWS